MGTIEIFLALFIFILIVLVSIEDISTGFLFLLVLITLQHKELFSLVFWDVLPIRIAFFGILLTTFYRFYLWFRRYKKKDVVFKFLQDPILILLVGLYIVRFVSILFVAENKIAGIKLLAFYTTIVYFYILLKYLYTTYGYAFIKKCLAIYASLGFITSVVAVVQYFVFKINGFKFGAIWEIPGHDPRVGSTFWDVNHFGAFLVSTIPLSISFIFSSKSYSRFFWAFNSFVMLYVLYLTESRSAWLGFAVASVTFVILLFLKGFQNFAKILGVVGVVVLTGVLVYFQFFGKGLVDQYKNFMHTRLDSFTTHFLLLRGAYDSYAKNPIFGAGYGNFNEVFRTSEFSEPYFFHEVNIVDQRVPSHSLWGEVISETGFLGFFFYTLIFIGLFLISLRGYFTSKAKDTLLLLGANMGVLGLLISGIFYTYNLEFFWFYIFFAVFTAYHFNKNLNTNTLFEFLTKLKQLPLFVLTFYSSSLLFWDLGKNKLIDWDEAIYAKVAKNIVDSGDFLTLTWIDGKNWFEKPPLYMWFSSKFMYLFGASELTARLPSALFSLGAVIAVYYFGKYLFKSSFVGFISGLMLITTADYWYYSRLGMLDVTVSFFILASLYFAYKYLDTYEIKFAFIAGIFCGLGVMTKAVVGFLPIPIIFIYLVYLVINKKVTLPKVSFGILSFLVTLLIVSLPWHLIMYQIHGSEFVDTYFKEHILNRGLTDSQGKTQPFFWYIERLKVSMRGWFLILIPSYFYLLYKSYKKSLPHIFLLTYSFFIFFFFSYSNTKLIWYIIPIYPALVLINGAFLKDFGYYLYTKISKLNNSSIIWIKNYTFSSLVGLFSVFFLLSLFLYNLNSHHLVYVPDFNKDLVSVVEDYNDKYVEDANEPKDTLYYLRIPTPVVAFYADTSVEATDVEPFTGKINGADFSESLVYISRQGEVSAFQNLYGADRVVVSENRGAYYLMYVRSVEEYYVAKVAEITSQVSSKISDYYAATSYEDKQTILQDIKNLQDEELRLRTVLFERLPNKYKEPNIIFFNGV